MLKQHQYNLPIFSKKILSLGCITNDTISLECANIANRHLGPIMLIVKDWKNVIQLYAEIPFFTRYPIIIFPDTNIIPYDKLSPKKRIISDRLSTLFRLSTIKRGIIILSIKTLMQKVCPHSFLYNYIILIKTGQKLSKEQLCNQLKKIGYRLVNKAMICGEFSIRNSILDICPIKKKELYRIEFFKNVIISMHCLDINSQCILHKIQMINLIPEHEFPTDHIAINIFKNQWNKIFKNQLDPDLIYQKVSKGNFPEGIENWLPLFFNEPLTSVFSYLPKNTLLISIGDLEQHANYFWKNICAQFEIQTVNLMRSLLAPDALWLRIDKLLDSLKNWPRIRVVKNMLPKKSGNININYRSLPNIKTEEGNKSYLEKLRLFCKQFDGVIIFSIKNNNRKKILIKLLESIKIMPKLITSLEDIVNKGNYLIVSYIEKGFIDTYKNQAFICEKDMPEQQIIYKNKNTQYITNTNVFFRNFSDIREGQLVVHLQHGIGRYSGMTTIEAGGIKAEYLVILYADCDKLYVPIASLHLVNRYDGNIDINTPLHKLGGESWSRARQKAVEQVRDIAAELLNIYSYKKTKIGFAFCYNKENYDLFCKDFPFKLTIDQNKAINEVIYDMSQPIIMDRLICGDVGFGKTEIAIRSAFLAVENRKQVVVLVPTTLLAQQHFDNFSDRFANWSVRIEILSRFRSTFDQLNILEKISQGKIDILIGTHKVLQKSIEWKDLGLLIVDEEHRFGVYDKERIKKIRSDIDTLTLTATPIPRTLSMAISGIRDISIITTPPSNRLAVKTFVCEYDAIVIRKAILRELTRGGQVYYLYNNVKKIDQVASKLAYIVPEAKIDIGHGQMHKHDLEKVINDFHNRRFDVLVCTTIIETGIDIINANTIVIEQADHFGLAQLHQLRGRVGRSNNQAYAYLITSPSALMTKDAVKRLDAIVSLGDLGAGFSLSTYDLEIRGAGELLGDNQSGQIKTIGFSIYLEMLNNAVNALKSGRNILSENILKQKTEIELCIPTLIPEDYIPDTNIRLFFYKRISNAIDEKTIQEITVEMIERFGLLPDPASFLLSIAKLRKKAEDLGIIRIDGNDSGGLVEFNKNNCIDPLFIVNLLQNKSNIYRLESSTKLRFICNLSDKKLRLSYIEDMISDFTQNIISI